MTPAGASCCAPRRRRATPRRCWRWPAGCRRGPRRRLLHDGALPRLGRGDGGPLRALRRRRTTPTTSWWPTPNASRRPSAASVASRTTCAGSSSARCPGQYRDLRAILEDFAADCIVVDSMFLGALPLALGPRPERPALACIGVMPYASSSRDTAPFGVAFQPGTGPLRRVRNATMNWATEHFVLADIQRFARRRLAEAGCAGFPGYFIDLQPKVVDAFLQATVAGFEYPRSDLAPSVRFVGPILAPPAQPSRSRRGGTSSEAAARSSTSPRARSTTRTWAGSCCVTDPRPGPRRRAGRRHHRRPRPRTAAARPAGERPAGALRPARPPAPPRRRHGDQRRATAACSRRWPTASPSWWPATARTSPRWRPACSGRARASTCTRAGPRRPWWRAPCAGCWPAAPTAGRARALQAEIAATDPLGTISGDAGRVVRGQRRRCAGPRTSEPSAAGEVPGRAGYSRRHAGRVQVRPSAPAAGEQAACRSRLVPRLGAARGSPRPPSCTGGSSTSSSAASPPRTIPSWPSSSTARRARASSWSG